MFAVSCFWGGAGLATEFLGGGGCDVHVSRFPDAVLWPRYAARTVPWLDVAKMRRWSSSLNQPKTLTKRTPVPASSPVPTAPNKTRHHRRGQFINPKRPVRGAFPRAAAAPLVQGTSANREPLAWRGGPNGFPPNRAFCLGFSARLWGASLSKLVPFQV